MHKEGSIWTQIPYRLLSSLQAPQDPLQVLLQPTEQVLGAWEEPPVGQVWVELQVAPLSSFPGPVCPSQLVSPSGPLARLSLQAQRKTSQAHAR